MCPQNKCWYQTNANDKCRGALSKNPTLIHHLVAPTQVVYLSKPPKIGAANFIIPQSLVLVFHLKTCRYRRIFCLAPQSLAPRINDIGRNIRLCVPTELSFTLAVPPSTKLKFAIFSTLLSMPQEAASRIFA